MIITHDCTLLMFILRRGFGGFFFLLSFSRNAFDPANLSVTSNTMPKLNHNEKHHHFNHLTNELMTISNHQVIIFTSRIIHTHSFELFNLLLNTLTHKFSSHSEQFAMNAQFGGFSCFSVSMLCVVRKMF